MPLPLDGKNLFSFTIIEYLGDIKLFVTCLKKEGSVYSQGSPYNHIEAIGLIALSYGTTFNLKNNFIHEKRESKHCVHLKNNPLIKGFGDNIFEAVGGMIYENPEEFGLEGIWFKENFRYLKP